MFTHPLTEAFFDDVSQDRYREFLTATREFALVRATKRHHVQPTASLPEGCLGVLCPACPQPKYNLHPRWQDRPEEDK